MLSLERLKHLLEYNPETGEFKWKVRRGGSASKGSIAGSINSEGYIHIGIDGTLYKAHRLAWFYITGYLPKNQLDHINGIRTDNRIDNLRQACNELNQKNNALRKDNLSGVPGVMWNLETGKWRSRITSSGRRYLLGDFKDKFEAICARKSAEVKYGFHLNHGRR